MLEWGIVRFKQGDEVKIAPKTASPERWLVLHGIVEGVPDWAASAWHTVDPADPVYLVSWDGDRLYSIVRQSWIAKAS